MNSMSAQLIENKEFSNKLRLDVIQNYLNTWIKFVSKFVKKVS